MKNAVRVIGSVVLCVCSSVCSLGQDQPPAKPQAAVPDQATLDKQFEEALSGSVLEGSFTVTGRESQTLRKEKYTLEKVFKLPQPDYWLFQARIQYGDHDVSVPLPLQVKWAGDTPIITLTDMMIPGLGTYTARVVIYRGQYAGTWSGGDHGGHLFGQVVKPTMTLDKEPTQEKTKQ